MRKSFSEEEIYSLGFSGFLFPNTESPLFKIINKHFQLNTNPLPILSILENEEIFIGNKLNDEIGLALKILENCKARIALRNHKLNHTTTFYSAFAKFVQFTHIEKGIKFSEAKDLVALTSEIVSQFPTQKELLYSEIKLDPDDFMAFNLIAANLLSAPVKETDDFLSSDELTQLLNDLDDDPWEGMHIDQSDPWEKSINKLEALGLISMTNGTPCIQEKYQKLGQLLNSDMKTTLSRYDFLDSKWLTREITFYIVDNRTLQFTTNPKGEVLLRELNAADLGKSLSNIISPLPKIKEISSLNLEF